MTGLPPPDIGDDVRDDGDPGSPMGMPRWVKAFVIVGLVIVLLVVVTLLLGIKHGPGRHTLPSRASSAVASQSTQALKVIPENLPGPSA
jgi:hypothetical protein